MGGIPSFRPEQVRLNRQAARKTFPHIGIDVLNDFLKWLKRKPKKWAVCRHEIFPKKPPLSTEIPEALHPEVIEMIRSAGIQKVYSHQSEAINLALQGKNVVLATPTASGKTLAYQAPVLDALVRDPNARALFLFPLKALERDQRDSFLAIAGKAGLTAAVYDGDTPEDERRKIRRSPPRVIVTNPDMLHLGFLAFHDSWKDFFGNLTHIVLDEVHTYKGIFGTHICQVLLRTKRICNQYGSTPRFFACSATISNPGIFVSTLIGEEVGVVEDCGSPTQERHFVFIDPVYSLNFVAADLFTEAVKLGLKTIVFTRARKITELITSWVLRDAPDLRDRISSYRAGFLPEERREIESRLFSGKMDGVISTSALEMGIDVGGLDLCILVGYPGTIINTWQRGGRVGRGNRPSAIILVAGNDALDQYFLNNPDDFFGRNCEEAVLDPTNAEVLKRHIVCAAAEIPISPEETWTQSPEVKSVLEQLEEENILFRHKNRSVWYAQARSPHRGVDLRSIGESFGIFLENKKTLIGSSAGKRVFSECHEGAVYLHRARQYLVTSVDLKKRNIMVRPAELHYYTKSLSEKETEILGVPIRYKEFPTFKVQEARLKVTEWITSYEKRKTSGHELIGVVDLELPPLIFETVGIWIEISESIRETIQKAGLHFMGGIHALEHAAISMFPLFALCDRDDIGGISTPMHEQVGQAAVFIYDGHPGGVGLSHRAFEIIEDLLQRTKSLVAKCACEEGCPSCIHSPKCGSGNKPLDKTAALRILEMLLGNPPKVVRRRPGVSENVLIEPQKAPPVEILDSPNIEFYADSISFDVSLDIVPPIPNAPNPIIFPDLAKETGREEIKKKKKSRNKVPPVIEIRVGKTGKTKPTAARSPLTTLPPGIAVFDLETKFLAQDVGGWKNVHKMQVSIGVVETSEGFRAFTEDKIDQLINMLKNADLVVGFNHLDFDYRVLSHYTNENLAELRNLDILQDVRKALGFRLSLDHLAECTLNRTKSGDGLDAVKWFREGKMDLLKKYCEDDVCLTRDLFLYGLNNGCLLYKRKDRSTGEVAVDWSSYGILPDLSVKDF